MADRERLHRLIDDLPEERIQTLEVMVALAMAPDDDEPATEEDARAFEEAWSEYLRGETIPAEEAKRRLLS